MDLDFGGCFGKEKTKQVTKFRKTDIDILASGRGEPHPIAK